MSEEKQLEEANEFEDQGIEVAEDKIPQDSGDYEDASNPDSDDLIASGSAGTEYDYNKAPEGISAPPRKDLDGQIVTIKEAKIILPPADRPWQKTRDGSKDVKSCTFKLFYDIDGQQEFYSGVRVFNRDGKYSHPTIMNDGKNQASALKVAYAKFKGKTANEVSMKEFMSFLNSQPKAKIKATEVTNPSTNQVVKKNLVEEFVQ